MNYRFMRGRFEDTVAGMEEIRTIIESRDPEKIRALLDSDAPKSLKAILLDYVDRFELQGMSDVRFEAAKNAAIRAVTNTPAGVEGYDLVLGFARALATATLSPAWSEDQYVPDPRFEWLQKKPAIDGSMESFTERLLSTYDLTYETAIARLTGGLQSIEATDLSAAQAAGLAQRRKDVLLAMFGGLTLDAGESLMKLASAPNLADLKKMGSEVGEAQPLSDHWRELTEKTLALVPADALAKLSITDHFVQSIGESEGAAFHNNHFIRPPVGEYGESLARAFAEAARIAMADARDVFDRVAGDASVFKGHGLYMASFGRLVLEEAVSSIVSSLSLLTAKRARDGEGRELSATELLDRIADDGLVTMLAGAAPMGLVVPLTLAGYMPSDPVTIPGKKALLPQSLLSVIHAARDARVLASAETAAHPYHRHLADGYGGHEIALRLTMGKETLRGCPVASRGPVVAADGTTAIGAKPPLHELVRGFVELTKRCLAELGASA